MSLKRAREGEDEEPATEKRDRMEEEEPGDPWGGLLVELWLLIAHSVTWPDPRRRPFEWPMARLLGCVGRRFHALLASTLRTLLPDWPDRDIYRTLHWHAWYGAFRPLRIVDGKTLTFGIKGEGPLDPCVVALGALRVSNAANVIIAQQAIARTPNAHFYSIEAMQERRLRMAQRVVGFISADYRSVVADGTAYDVDDLVRTAFEFAPSMDVIMRLADVFDCLDPVLVLQRAVESGRVEAVRYLLTKTPPLESPWWVVEANPPRPGKTGVFRFYVLALVMEHRLYDFDLLERLLCPPEMREACSMQWPPGPSKWLTVFEYASGIDAASPDAERLIVWWLSILSPKHCEIFVAALLLRSQQHARMATRAVASIGYDSTTNPYTIYFSCCSPRFVDFLRPARRKALADAAGTDIFIWEKQPV